MPGLVHHPHASSPQLSQDLVVWDGQPSRPLRSEFDLRVGEAPEVLLKRDVLTGVAALGVLRIEQRQQDVSVAGQFRECREVVLDAGPLAGAQPQF